MTADTPTFTQFQWALSPEARFSLNKMLFGAVAI
jgi:hypothetical protein